MSGGGGAGGSVKFYAEFIDINNGAMTLQGMSSADAYALATAAGGKWCCDSCGTASWL